MPVVDQRSALSAITERIDQLRNAGMRALVCVDLDLTSLLAPKKSVETLRALSGRAGEIAKELQGVDDVLVTAYVNALRRIWTDTDTLLLPGYTTTAIEGYALYLIAQLTHMVDASLSEEGRDRCEQWVHDQVHALLRNGYWDRDLMSDTITPGFSQWLDHLTTAGGEAVFLSNRPPSSRAASLAKIQAMVGGNGRVFAFFGPGGSAYDASSKAKAVAMLEHGCAAGLYFAELVDGGPVYSNPNGTDGPAILAAIIDDRAENRRQVIDAAEQSFAYWQAAGFGEVIGLAVAATGFCPEVAIVESAFAISSFE
ncbi:MAG: hypothetical protein H8K08_03145 [Nitrospira sp.]|nr:hypothetical protein [Nitrospira sp.]